MRNNYGNIEDLEDSFEVLFIEDSKINKPVDYNDNDDYVTIQKDTTAFVHIIAHSRNGKALPSLYNFYSSKGTISSEFYLGFLNKFSFDAAIEKKTIQRK